MTTLNIKKAAAASPVRIPDDFERVAMQFHAEQQGLLRELKSIASKDADKARQLARHYLSEDNSSVKLGRIIDAWCIMHPQAANDEDVPYLHLIRFAISIDMWAKEIEPELRHAKARFLSTKNYLPVDQLRERARALLANDVECILGNLGPDEIAAFVAAEPKN